MINPSAADEYLMLFFGVFSYTFHRGALSDLGIMKAPVVAP